MSLGDSRIKRVWDRIAFLSMLTVRVVVLEYSQLHKRLRTSEFVSLEALKMYCMMRASMSSLYKVYQLYDTGISEPHQEKLAPEIVSWKKAVLTGTHQLYALSHSECFFNNNTKGARIR